MKKTLLKSALIAIAGVGLMTGSAFADEMTVQQILDSITTLPTPGISSVNAATDMLDDGDDSYWEVTASGGSFATMIIEIAGWASTNVFGVYDSADPTNFVELFNGAATTGSQSTLGIKADGSVIKNLVDTGIDFSSGIFGYYLGVGSNFYYSDTTLNSGGYDRMLAYQGNNIDTVKIADFDPGVWTNNEYILAFEDSTDFDYNDMVLMVESVRPVPEPATMLLFGTGLVGLAGFARRRKN